MAPTELSLDILVLIVKQVDVTDRLTISRICLACKSLNAIASPILYSHLDIRLDGKSKSDDVALIRRVIEQGHASHVTKLKVRGDRLVELERPHLKRTSTLEVKANMSISMLLSDPDPPMEDAPGEDLGEKGEEPLLELVKQCKRLRKVEWAGVSESYETVRMLAGLMALKEVALTFRRSIDEAGMPCDDLAQKTFAFNEFKGLTNLELLMVSGEAAPVRSGLIDVLFNNTGLKRLAISLDVQWYHDHEYAIELEVDDERLGAFPNWFVVFINAVIARMKKESKPILLDRLEELHLLEGMNLTDEGDINLHEIIDLTKLRRLTYTNTPQFESTYEAPENYSCFLEHATNIEYVSVNTVTDTTLDFLRDLPNLKKLHLSSSPDFYDSNKLESLMDGDLEVECDRWDVKLWYKNRIERGGDPYGGFD